MSWFGFHPLIERWFRSRFAAPTEPQRLAWPHIAAGQDTLIAAPTGSGKTFTAFLACIDRLLKAALDGRLEDQTRVVYVSPLRALSNDMHRNLEIPLAEIRQIAAEEGLELPPITIGLRTGDTSASARAALVRTPRHILVSTPESLYLMLTGHKSRETLRRAETVIVDEIHALVRDKRGSHLALSLERLEALCERPLQRIGLSATQRPIERVAEFLAGARKVECGMRKDQGIPTSKSATQDEVRADFGIRSADWSPQGRECPIACAVINVGHDRPLDLAIETPASELGAVCMHEQWAEVNARLVELIGQHRSTLIFVNTRRLAERVTHQLTELLGDGVVGSHHGSLSADIRLDTERRLKEGGLKAVVATASLELGLDIGYIDLVVQIGSPRSIATFLQRIGRSGHSLGLVPKGRLFALTRDELLEAMALLRAVRAGRLDAIPIPQAPLDVLAQQIVAEVATRECGTEELFELCRRAAPYAELSRTDFDRTVEFLSEGIVRGSGRGRVYVHHDHVGRRLRARRGARIAAVCNGGAIPEIASYRVVAQPEGTVVGTLDEDFAVESNSGDVFLLGNTSWRIQNIRGGDVNVLDAHGAPPTIPFWRGEAPGRTWELSEEVSRLREELEARLDDPAAAEAWLAEETHCSPEAAHQAIQYAAAQRAAIGLLPTQRRVVFERFFDETGGMQLVVHAPFGGAVNRAWGLAMRKRFCRSFDFELQATADDNGFILSLGPQHSFPIESLFGMLTRQNARPLLEQALLAVPLFQIRWRWNVTRALQVLRTRNGKKVPPALQRFRADDLLTAVFPKLTGCQENVVGDLEVPEHPLVRQTMQDCLHEAVDLPALERILAEIEAGRIELIARDTREPSPFCYELLNSNPYTFLDGGEIQERRARAVSTRRSLTVESVSDLGRLDPEAIRQVVAEAQPLVRNADELHDVLLSRVVLPVDPVGGWQHWFCELAEAGRAATLRLPDGQQAWVSAERLPAARAAFPESVPRPVLAVPDSVPQQWSSIDARLAIVRGLLEVSGPVTAAEAAQRSSLSVSQAEAALEALEGEGMVLRGRFRHGPMLEPRESAVAGEESSAQRQAAGEEIRTATPQATEWCHRRLLARMHRLTLEGLRREIEPVGVDVYWRFLARQHGVVPGHQRSGPSGLYEVIAALEGLDVPAVCWERDLLPVRVEGYRPEWLDELCLAGEVGWGRLFPPKPDASKSKPMAALTRVAPVSLWLRQDLAWLTANRPLFPREALSSPAVQLLELLEQRGALFAADLLRETRMLPAELPEVIGELVTRGLVTADGFAGLRQLLAERRTARESGRRARRRGRLPRKAPAAGAGRWSIFRPVGGRSCAGVDEWARLLLRRWGVMFRDLLLREAGAPGWFELLQVYRRWEARGEIRGGRFIRGVAGEQFALGESVRKLRQLRDEAGGEELVTISAADPLNLAGILTGHPRVPSTAGNRVVYRRGRPAAALQASEIVWLEQPPDDLRPAIAERLGVPRGKARPLPDAPIPACG